jgi:hypothetical protein
MRIVVAVLSSFTVFASFALCGMPARAAPPLASHPILGIWLLALPGVGCVETYRFRGDGTTLVTSAAEVSESTFTIPDRPSGKGFYKLDDVIVKDNGKRDCGGEIMKVGTRATNYVLFNPGSSVFVLCTAESTEQCIGPFRRVVGQDA